MGMSMDTEPGHGTRKMDTDTGMDIDINMNMGIDMNMNMNLFERIYISIFIYVCKYVQYMLLRYWNYRALASNGQSYSYKVTPLRN